MINDPSKEISIDELKERIRAQVARIKSEPRGKYQQDDRFRRSPEPFSASGSIHETKIWNLLKKIQAKLQKYSFYHFIHKEATRLKRFVPRFEERYVLGDLLKYRDGEFIERAYEAILKRPPDSVGLKHYLTKLRKADLHKIEIIGRLRYSREGREKRVKIKGLSVRFFLYTAYHIPIAGYLLKLLMSLISLPKILTGIQEYEAFTDARFSQNTIAIKELSSGIEARLVQLTQMHEILSAAVNEIRGELAGKANTQLINDINSEIKTMLDQIRDHKLHILDQQARLTQFLEEARKRLPEPFSPEQLLTIAKEEDHLLDAMYVSFEDRFRGSREDIKERARVYLPYMEQTQAGTPDTPILDIGCGRGEWLELLKENGHVAKGIDLNRVMIADCRERGFDVRESDAIEFIKNQSPNSFGAITGFHLVEHLPLKTLIRLFDESRRVLKVGGVVIFETPNPENLMVGACNFYVDPTHVRPLPPITIQFIAEARGFDRVSVRRLTENRIDKIPPDIDSVTQQVYYTAPDYALIAFKA